MGLDAGEGKLYSTGSGRSVGIFPHVAFKCGSSTCFHFVHFWARRGEAQARPARRTGWSGQRARGNEGRTKVLDVLGEPGEAQPRKEPKSPSLGDRLRSSPTYRRHPSHTAGRPARPARQRPESDDRANVHPIILNGPDCLFAFFFMLAWSLANLISA